MNVDGSPHGEHEAATRPKDPVGRTKGARLVGEELQPLLACDDVEVLRGEGQFVRIPATPVDRVRLGE